jgi:hypothetical protein
VSTLAHLPLELNSNDFHFDTEIILQLLNAGARIVELPIPTFYGDEISRVNGLAYARNVALATLRNAAHRAGILYQRKYDVAPDDDHAHRVPKLGYPSSHTYALEAVPPRSRVMGLGAGPDHLAQELEARQCSVTLVGRVTPPEVPPSTAVIVRDLDADPLELDLSRVDVLLLLDVIEHRRNPGASSLRSDATWTIDPTQSSSTPPTWPSASAPDAPPQAVQLGRAGILDLTHTRLFTPEPATDPQRFRTQDSPDPGIPAPVPEALGGDNWLGAGCCLSRALIRVSPALLVPRSSSRQRRHPTSPSSSPDSRTWRPRPSRAASTRGRRTDRTAATPPPRSGVDATRNGNPGDAPGAGHGSPRRGDPGQQRQSSPEAWRPFLVGALLATALAALGRPAAGATGGRRTGAGARRRTGGAVCPPRPPILSRLLRPSHRRLPGSSSPWSPSRRWSAVPRCIGARRCRVTTDPSAGRLFIAAAWWVLRASFHPASTSSSSSGSPAGALLAGA